MLDDMTEKDIEYFKHFENRFADALRPLCSNRRPSNKLVVEWLSHKNDDLQEWVLNNSSFVWAQGIGIIDAALEIAQNPMEGYGFKEQVIGIDENEVLEKLPLPGCEDEDGLKQLDLPDHEFIDFIEKNLISYDYKTKSLTVEYIYEGHLYAFVDPDSLSDFHGSMNIGPFKNCQCIHMEINDVYKNPSIAKAVFIVGGINAPSITELNSTKIKNGYAAYIWSELENDDDINNSTIIHHLEVATPNVSLSYTIDIID